MKSILILLFTIISAMAFSQGKLMVVGGGAEDLGSGGWSETPYTWAVEQAANRKVGIISFNDESQVLPDYFLSLGASVAENIRIHNRTLSEDQAMLDSLLQYDLLFFKGGNQENYYNIFRDSRVTEAMQQIFNRGGVLAGTSAGAHILSEVVFTSEEGTVYPDEGLGNINSERFTLRNDLVSVLPGTLFDSHFIERGRLARLAAFLSRWFSDEGELITGIGLDDKTAFCINELGVGTAYGTGAVTILSGFEFEFEGDHFAADSINMVQLLEGYSYDLNSMGLPENYTTVSSSMVQEESQNAVIYLSGSDPLGENAMFIQDFSQEGSSEAPILIVTGSNINSANSLKQELADEGVTDVQILQTIPELNQDRSAGSRNDIRRSEKVIFIRNEHDELDEFLNAGPTGALLNDHIRRNGMILGFIGQDALLAGKRRVTNHLENALNSFRGNLEFSDGLGVLETSIIMSNTIDLNDNDFYENAVSSVLYSMIKDRLRLGIMIHAGSYVRFFQENDENWLESKGDLSSVIVTNESGFGDLAEERNVVGYDVMQLSVIHDQSRRKAGTVLMTEDEPYVLEIVPPESLSATWKEGDIELIWEDQSDNETGFEIERMDAGGEFQLIATTSTNEINYLDVDDFDEDELPVYRVRGINSDTVSLFSNESEVEIVTSLNEDPVYKMKVFPNPIDKGWLNIHTNSNGNYELKIRDLQGRLVFWNSVKGGKRLDVSALESAIYFLEIRGGGRTEIYRIIVNE
jgi:cyanophycinase